MQTLLHLSVSARGEASHSRRVGQELVARIRAAQPGLRLLYRDLAQHPPPHPDRPFVEASLMADADRGPAQHAALAYSESLITELEASDGLLIDSPMNNFTVPSALKAWIDHVVRPRRTFRSTPDGKVGLLQDRPVWAVIACGGSFAPGSAQQTDFFSPYLRYVLSSIGISHVEVLRLSNMTRGAEPVERARQAAQAWIEDQVVRWRGAGSVSTPV